MHRGMAAQGPRCAREWRWPRACRVRKLRPAPEPMRRCSWQKANQSHCLCTSESETAEQQGVLARAVARSVSKEVLACTDLLVHQRERDVGAACTRLAPGTPTRGLSGLSGATRARTRVGASSCVACSGNHESGTHEAPSEARNPEWDHQAITAARTGARSRRARRSPPRTRRPASTCRRCRARSPPWRPRSACTPATTRNSANMPVVQWPEQCTTEHCDALGFGAVCARL